MGRAFNRCLSSSPRAPPPPRDHTTARETNRAEHARLTLASGSGGGQRGATQPLALVAVVAIGGASRAHTHRHDGRPTTPATTPTTIRQ